MPPDHMPAPIVEAMPQTRRNARLSKRLSWRMAGEGFLVSGPPWRVICFRSYDAVTSEKLLQFAPAHLLCIWHCASFRRARIDGVRSRSENRSMLCRGISSASGNLPHVYCRLVGDFAPQGPRYQTGTLGLFDQAKSALAIFFSGDRQDRTQGYLRELEPALDLLECSGRGHLQRHGFEFRKLGYGRERRYKTTCDCRHQKMFRRPLSGWPLKFHRRGEADGLLGTPCPGDPVSALRPKRRAYV